MKVSEGLALQISSGHTIDSACNIFGLIDMLSDSDIVALAQSIAALCMFICLSFFYSFIS